MQYRRVWILCIFTLALGILLAVPVTGRTTPAELLVSNGPAINATGRSYPEERLWNLPPVPRFYRETIPTGVGREWIDLSWTNLNNPHTVVIYTPETALGPFQNTDNGVLDRRIFLEISSGRNLTPGSWYYQVLAAKAASCGNDTFRIYRNTGD